MNIKLSVVFIIFLLSFNLNAQYITKSCVGDYAKSYLKDSKKYILAPLNWKKQDVLIFSGAVAIGGVLFWKDEWIQQQINLPNSNQELALKYGFNYFGNGYYSLPLLGSMFLYGAIAKKEKPFNTALSGVKAFTLSTIVTRILKYSFNRYRVEENRGSDFFGGPFTPFSLSFPSGHTTAAFAIATVLAKNYKHKLLIPIASFTLATGVGVARIWSKDHWASDVFVGALVGWSVGTIVSNIDCSNKKSSFKIEGNGISYVF